MGQGERRYAIMGVVHLAVLCATATGKTRGEMQHMENFKQKTNYLLQKKQQHISFLWLFKLYLCIFYIFFVCCKRTAEMFIHGIFYGSYRIYIVKRPGDMRNTKSTLKALKAAAAKKKEKDSIFIFVLILSPSNLSRHLNRFEF